MDKISFGKRLKFYLLGSFFAIIFTFRLVSLLQVIFDSPNPNPFTLLSYVSLPMIKDFLIAYPVKVIPTYMYVLAETPSLLLLGYLSIELINRSRLSLLLLQSSILPLSIKIIAVLLITFFATIFLSDEEAKWQNLGFFAKVPLTTALLIIWPLQLLYIFTKNPKNQEITKLSDPNTYWYNKIPGVIIVIFLMAIYALFSFISRIPLILENLDYVKKFIKYILETNPVSKQKEFFYISSFYWVFYTLIAFYILLPISIIVLIYKRRLGFFMVVITSNLFIPISLIIVLPMVHIVNSIVGHKILTATIYTQIILLITLISSYITFLIWQRHRAELTKYFNTQADGALWENK